MLMMKFCAKSSQALTKIAQRWFHQLSKNSVSFFEKLAKKFRTRFITNIPPTKSIHNLRVCKQEVNESLKNYLDRFNKVTIQIENLSDKTTIETMKNETRLGKLKDKIMTKESTTFLQSDGDGNKTNKNG